MGHADEAARLVTIAFENYTRSGIQIGATDAPIVMSKALIAMGKHQEALGVLDQFVAGRELLGTPMQIYWEVRRAAAFDALGAADKAESIVREQVRRLGELPQSDRLRFLENEARILLGRLLIKRQHAAEAREMIETSMY